MQLTRSAGWLAAILALGAALLPSGAAEAETVLRRGNGAAPATLDPHLNFGARDAWIQDDLYEGLVATGADGEVIPGAAESWDLSDDGLTYTFHLRDGLKWSDGTPLVAQDFVNGVIRTLDPKTASEKGYYFFSVMQVEGAKAFNAGETTDPATVGFSAPDDTTVVMKLINPAPHALRILNSFQTTPLHKPSFDAEGIEFVRAGKMISNGAYMLVEQVPQSHLVLRKNPHYWDAANVAIDEVRYFVTEDVPAETRRFKAGELDITNDFAGEELEALKAELGDQAHISPNTYVYYLSFNLKKPPFDDIRVRQALALAVDREALVGQVLRSGEPPLYSYVPEIDAAYDSPLLDLYALPREERLEKARALLAEAGYGPDNPLKLDILSTNEPGETREAVALSIMWKPLGVQVSFTNQEFQAWLDSFYAGTFDVFNDNLVGDFAGAESYLATCGPRPRPATTGSSRATTPSWTRR